jgi:hypothetical protein
VLKFEAAFFAIVFPANDYERSHEADHFKVSIQFFGAPDLAVLGFECFSAARLGVDLGEAVATIGFSGVGH